jgi:2-iminobutanoate/2-iminopropanoate deaminase
MPAVNNESLPLSEYTTSGNSIYTVQVPDDETGRIITGGIREQTYQVLANLKRTMEKAGSTIENVDQVLIYLINEDDFAVMNEVYRSTLKSPFPSRATVVVKKLLEPGMLIEIVAFGHRA